MTHRPALIPTIDQQAVVRCKLPSCRSRSWWRFNTRGKPGRWGNNLPAIAHWLCLSLLTVPAFAGPQATLTVVKQGQVLQVSAAFTKAPATVEIWLNSTRNETISKVSDISPGHPYADRRKVFFERHDRDIWYPVVDVALEPGMDGLLEFSMDGAAECIIGGPWSTIREPVRPLMRASGAALEHWENSIFVEPNKARLSRFTLVLPVSVTAGAVHRQFRLLSPAWEGTVAVVDPASGARLAEQAVSSRELPAPPVMRGGGLSRRRLIDALDFNIDFVMRCRIDETNSPMSGGLFLFYDRASRSYRTPHWMWGWGPTIRMLLDASWLHESRYDGDRLRRVAEELGRCTLRLRWHEPGDVWHGASISEWVRGVNRGPDGHLAALNQGCSMFLAGWAWLPLYKATGDREFLDATYRQVEIIEALAAACAPDPIPHNYYPEVRQWSGDINDEDAFGTEGFAELYLMTGDRHVREVGRKFLDQFVSRLQREDGRWNRMYFVKTKQIQEHVAMTRSAAWSVESLLAGWRLLGEPVHLTNAQKTADFLLKAQLPDGSWPFQYDQDPAVVGISEKGTAIWSYFLYRLHAETGETRFLQAARRALKWCLDNQYFGPDPDGWGGIFGQTPASGVGYREFFPLACTYTAGFFGLAILEELNFNASVSQ